MKNINIEELCQVLEKLKTSTFDLDTNGTEIVFNALYDANKNNFQELLIEVREHELNEYKKILQIHRTGNHYATCALQQFSKGKKTFVKNDIPLLFPIILANYPNGIQGHSESEKVFYNKFKESFLNYRHEFSDDWLKQYGYIQIVKQFCQ